MGALGRGETMEITTYLEKALSSELSGNIIDLCPVGALTSKPYAYVSRPWELKKTETVDVMDALGSNIRIDTRGGEVLRVLPRVNEEVNEEWISDKTRFSCDGLKRQRLDTPYIRVDGKLVPTNWDEALNVVASKFRDVSGESAAAIAGDLCDAESMFALKTFMKGLKVSDIDCRQDGAKLDSYNRGSYIFNSKISGVEFADAILLVGSNPRWEAPVLNARIRKRWLEISLPIAHIGLDVDLTYDSANLGNSPKVLKEILEGKSPFSDVLAKAQRPMLIFGMGALTREDGDSILGLGYRVAEKYEFVKENDEIVGSWNGFNVLHTAASRVAGLDMGFVPNDSSRGIDDILEDANSGKIKLVYLLGADEIDMSKLGEAFVVYQGHHGDAGAHRADVILPGAAYTEKDGLYVNTEGRTQLGVKAAFPPGDAREDWRIIRALSGLVGEPLPFDDIHKLRKRLIESCRIFGDIDQIETAAWGQFGKFDDVDDSPFDYKIRDFYMTDPISRSSVVMAECSQVNGAEEVVVGGAP
tara:strand:- start:399 stop:1985 length:1587 start_codon:yes stop_codon:yes gene_type:complete